jgi:hypothetical protein
MGKFMNRNDSNDMASIETICHVFKDRILQRRICIPNYQRDYEWDEELVVQLLEDLFSAISGDSEHPEGREYRLGTLILHVHEDHQVQDVVDGQQRLITLALVYLYLNSADPGIRFCRKGRLTLETVKSNWRAIGRFFERDDDESRRKCFNRLFNEDTKVKFVVLEVDELSEAFQLYDTQNGRGKELDAADILKAHHLQAVNRDDVEADVQEEIVTAWEDEIEDIKSLFNLYLYPVLNWSNLIYAVDGMPRSDWGMFRGVSPKDRTKYGYASAVSDNGYQIVSPFTDGLSFFKYVFYYLSLKKTIEAEDKLQGYPYKFRKEEPNPDDWVSVEVKYSNPKDHPMLYWINMLRHALKFAYVDRFKRLKVSASELSKIIDLCKDKDKRETISYTKEERDWIERFSFYYRLNKSRVSFNGINSYVVNKHQPFWAMLRAQSPSEFFKNYRESILAETVCRIPDPVSPGKYWQFIAEGEEAKQHDGE